MTFPYPAMYPSPQVSTLLFQRVREGHTQSDDAFRFLTDDCVSLNLTQGQSQVTYGGVTYYDTMQQQAQPKPSPPRRTSQPVTVKPPPPELHFASE